MAARTEIVTGWRLEGREAGAVDAALRMYVERMRETATIADKEKPGLGAPFTDSADAAGRVIARLDDGFAPIWVGNAGEIPEPVDMCAYHRRDRSHCGASCKQGFGVEGGRR